MRSNILSAEDFAGILRLKDFELSAALRGRINDLVQAYENSAKESRQMAESFTINNLEKILNLEKAIIEDNRPKKIIMEIRAGVGGDEGAIFAADLARMYYKYAESQGWKLRVLYPAGSLKSIKSCKECVFSIEGAGVESLGLENGVHRVQRVPATETQGRMHTSTATVVIVPEEEHKKININTRDLEITACKASGAGGQHVNTTDSAIRIRHKPSGLVVTSQSERSQHQNRQIAMEKLKQQLVMLDRKKRQANTQSIRRASIGGAGRNEKIRSYHGPRNKIKDHRLGKSYNLEKYLYDGKISTMLADCQAFANKKFLIALKNKVN
jgi:peptide chain release factor 1